MSNKILIVDDEPRIRKLVSDYLVKSGYLTAEASDGSEAIDIFMNDKSISLIILDVMMPNMDGYETLQSIRSFSEIPVIMLTAKGEEKDELKGFDLGVDEYISKPFSPALLTARVNAILRRVSGEDSGLVSCDGIVVDKKSHTVKIDNNLVELSIKEFELLVYFIENANIALSRDVILNNVWNYSYYGDSRTIDTHVKKLRSKIEPYGNRIKTIWGMGYKFETSNE